MLVLVLVFEERAGSDAGVLQHAANAVLRVHGMAVPCHVLGVLLYAAPRMLLCNLPTCMNAS